MRSTKVTLWVWAVCVAWVLVGCGADESVQCETDEQCGEGQRCVLNACEVKNTLDALDIIGGVDVPVVVCEGGVAPAPGQLRINEIHAAPGTSDDTNCDGVPGADDEFIEIVNNSDVLLDLNGVQVKYDGNLKVGLAGCLAPGRGLVVYGGEGVQAMCEDYGETLVSIAPKALAMSNSGKSVSLDGADGTNLETVVYPSITGNNSWTRLPDFTGEFVFHGQVVGATTKFSAGKCVSGEALVLGCPPPEDTTIPTDCDDAVPAPEGALRINEIHAAPKAGEPAHDANCDGNPSSTQDEFVEIVNASAQKVSLAGVQVLVNGNLKHTLNTCLAPGRGLVVYSGGTAACTDLGETQAFVSEKAFSLTNSGGAVALADANGTPFETQPYASISDSTSRTRFPDFTGGTLVSHSTKDILGVTTPHSAGKCVSGAPLAPDCPPPGGASAECGNAVCEPGESSASCPDDCNATTDCTDAAAPIAGDLKINEVHPAPKAGDPAHDANCDGNPSSTQDEFVEIVNTSAQKVLLDGVQLQVGGATKSTLSGCLAPGRGIVVYSGGTAACANFGETKAAISTSALSLTNSGSAVSLLDAGGVSLDNQPYTSVTDNTSRTLFPDFTGTALVKHAVADIPGVTTPHSAGHCVSGAPLAPDCPPPGGTTVECGNGACEAGEDSTSCPDDCSATGCGNSVCDSGETFETCAADCPPPVFCEAGATPAPGDVKINEIHFAPLSSADDVNCDGTNTSDDEYIELINTSGQLLNLAGMTLSYDGTSRHTFTAQEACLATGQALVFYNRNLVPLCSSDQLGGSVAVVTRSAFSMVNSSAKTISIDLDGTNLDTTTYAIEGTNNGNSSWTRSPDISGDFAKHSTAPGNIGRFSVGVCLNGGRFPDCEGSAGPVCGNGTCEAGEDATSCAQDCAVAPTCGDGTCNGTENSTTCLQDCPVTPTCGDGTCNGTENSTTCLQDCPITPTCGDGTCNGTETTATCSQDCPATPTCGDGTCNGTETTATCSQDCPAAPCAAGVAPAAGDLAINEIHFAPLSSADDVNCDSLTSADDEFVEFVNATTQTLNLAGVTVSFAGTLRHTFTAEQACLAPGQGLVLYNALAAAVTTICTPGASSVGGSLTVKSSSRFQMGNTTAGAVSVDLGGTNLDLQTYTTNSGNSSWTRSPDITGGFLRHSTAPSTVGRFSLGTCVNGNTFPNCQ